MITIDQLLESVDLDFEPRWVAMDYCGEIFVFDGRPYLGCEGWYGEDTESQCFGKLKLAEFENKDWQECIYEVPRKVDYTKWFEKLCRFWDDGASNDGTQQMVRLTYGILTSITDCSITPFECDNTYEFEHCEPVRPDDDVIYKDAVNELKGAKNE